MCLTLTASPSSLSQPWGTAALCRWLGWGVLPKILPQPPPAPCEVPREGEQGAGDRESLCLRLIHQGLDNTSQWGFNDDERRPFLLLRHPWELGRAGRSWLCTFPDP